MSTAVSNPIMEEGRSEQQYELQLKGLRSALLARGYPFSLLKPVPYAKEKRESILQQLALRTFGEAPVFKESVLVFKLPFTSRFKHLGLKTMLMAMIAEIRRHYGQSFLADTKVVVAIIPR